MSTFPVKSSPHLGMTRSTDNDALDTLHLDSALHTRQQAATNFKPDWKINESICRAVPSSFKMQGNTVEYSVSAENFQLVQSDEAFAEFYGVETGREALRLINNSIYPSDVNYVSVVKKWIPKILDRRSNRDNIIKVSYQFRTIDPLTNVIRVLLHEVRPMRYDHAEKVKELRISQTDVSHMVVEPTRFLNAVCDDSLNPLRKFELEGFTSEAKGLCPYSERQLDIINLLAHGLSSTEIAKRLFISADTVRTHRQHILKKSAQNNMTATVVECVKNRWI